MAGGVVRDNLIYGNGSTIADYGGVGTASFSGNVCDSGGTGCAATGGAGTTSAGANGSIGSPGSPPGGAAGCSTSTAVSASKPTQQLQQSSGTAASAKAGGSSQPAASSGQACFTLGGKNLSAEGYDIAAKWQQQKGVKVTPYSNLSSATVSGLGAHSPADGQAQGVGVAGGQFDGEVDQGEGVVLNFDEPQTNLTVGLRNFYVESQATDGVETALWVAYKDGKVVAQGKADADPANTLGTDGVTGQSQFEIAAEEGFDQVVLYSDEYESNFGVEYVEAKNPAGCGNSSGGATSSKSSTSKDSSSGSASNSNSSGSGSVSTSPRSGSGSSGPRCSSASASPTPNGHVFYVAPGGSDSGAGTEGNPFGSIEKALSMMKPGDTLYLHGGEYDEAISPNAWEPGGGLTIPSGGNSWEEAITIAGYPGERAVIEGVTLNSGMGVSYLVFDNLVMNDGFYFGDNHHIRLSNSEVVGHPENYLANYEEIKRQYEAWGRNDGQKFMEWANQFEVPNLIMGNGNNVEIIGNDIHGGFYGMYSNGQDMLIEGNDIHDNMGSSASTCTRAVAATSAITSCAITSCMTTADTITAVTQARASLSAPVRTTSPRTITSTTMSAAGSTPPTAVPTV
jgi:hypothetical protein